MCSINGCNSKDEELMRRMNRVTEHRGPDGTGIFSDDTVTLGHNRLSVIDLSEAGAQPMRSVDGRFVIVFNGEVYNYRELRRELSQYTWRSESDTEVILAAYAAWGVRMFARLNGIFALALYDTKTGALVLARDPMGVKPLYYHERAGRIIFASEIKAILEDTRVPRRIDQTALDLYLRLNYVPAPLSLFSGIKKLLPGHYLTVTRGGALSTTSFSREGRVAPSTLPAYELSQRLYEEVHASVKRQLVSDRPVGLSLSGGVDSSAVLESMADARGRVETFSVGFKLRENEEAEKFNADFLLARKTAQHFGAIHHEVLISPQETISLFEDAVHHLDEPVANATIIPQLALARFSKRRVAVMLGGDGGDELFGGYERYRLSLLSSRYRLLPASVRAAADALLPPLRKLDTAPGIDRFAQFHFLKEEKLKPLLSPIAYREYSASGFFTERFFREVKRPFETQFMRVDRESWLVDESLLRTDKMNMAAGLEARVPLLDLPLVSFADAILLKHKVSLSRTKIILKKAFEGRIPDGLLSQPKRGWFSPGAKWLRYREMADFAREVLSARYTEATEPLFNWEAVRARLDAHLRGEYHFTELWMILTLQLWARQFKLTA